MCTFEIPPLPPSTPRPARYLLSTLFVFSNLLLINILQYPSLLFALFSRSAFLFYMKQCKRLFAYFCILYAQIFAPSKYVFSGWNVFEGETETVILIPNHQLYSDWLFVWSMAYVAKAAHCMKIIAKESTKYVPITGWGMMLFEFIFLKRRWAQDQGTMRHYLTKYLGDKAPLWLLIFPEGTNVCKVTREKSHAFSEKQKLPKLDLVLLPKSTGLFFCSETLRSSAESNALKAIYDITIAFDGVPPFSDAYDTYSLTRQFFLGMHPTSIFFHIERIPVERIPRDEETFSKWLRYRFYVKDKMLHYFHTHQHFPRDRDWEDTTCLPENPFLWSKEEQDRVVAENGARGQGVEQKSGDWLAEPRVIPMKVKSILSLFLLPSVFIPIYILSVVYRYFVSF